ncbi:DUF3383 family protein [Budvicia aquatica]|uniref:DUF3383 domain-containing protein n=1 Tax=Budvicia aquatica TaxID=82979 RepID=A0A2C6BZZ6_9GAMM|nr:DUF3383 family protein [Budvicia aquatica]PHI29690.1 DUF3383 domain-containing protein [Budvicia aquatica]VFS48072.1 Protein of uncharacterised function (DUF3383) [Budvicia aquatica]
MGSLNQIVNVNIALSTTSVPRGVFGVPMIIAPLTTFTERVRVYLDYNAAVEDQLPADVLKALSAVFSQTPRPQMCKVGRLEVDAEGKVVAATLGAQLTAIQAEDANWYGFALTERNPELQMAAAEWAETQTKMFFTSSSEEAITDASSSDDVLSKLAAKNFLRTAVIVDKHAADQYLEMAWMGRCFTIAPGGETWALKQLSGVQASDWSATEQQTIVKKGGNTFERFAPQIYLTTPGKVVSGEWVDVVRFRDWLADAIQTSLSTLMINRNKVPYTDGGIALIVNNLTGSLIEGQRVGGIAPDEIDADGNNVKGFVITYPRSVDVSFQDKAERVLNLSFSARLAGAIHLTNINGNLSYELQ